MSGQAWLKGEIVTTGTEILLGEIVDTNAAWIAQRLNAIGINLYYKSTVGDNEQRLTRLLEVAMHRSDVVIVTGGLGPTADDITREAIAGAFGTELVLDGATVENLRSRFSNWGTRMTANNQKQALIPEGAEIVPNPVGTAPGILMRQANRMLFALPGVPREMKRMMEDSVLPMLQARTRGQGVIQVRTLRTIGIGESSIDHEISDLMASANPTVGLAAHTGQADVRLTARGLNEREATAMLDDMEGRVRERIGIHIYSDRKDADIARHMVELMEEKGASLALYEPHTQGWIGTRLRDHGGDSILTAPWQNDPTLEQAARQSLPDDETDLEGYGRAMDYIHALLRQGNDADCRLVVLGTTDPEHGVYQQRKGFTLVKCMRGAQVREARFSFGGPDELTAVWVGNRCFDLMRRLYLDMD